MQKLKKGAVFPQAKLKQVGYSTHQIGATNKTLSLSRRYPFFWRHFFHLMRNDEPICQDRLGTNLKKSNKRGVRFAQANGTWAVCCRG